MSKAGIRFSTDILRRLGEELNPSVDKGILELVKNSHDADATECTVEILNSEVGGTIIVKDNGKGMNESNIADGWLVLGASTKTKKRTAAGRIPAGSKGLGRLAALRMGNKAFLKTRPQDNFLTEYSLNINWKDYESKRLVEEVVLEIDETPSDVGFGGTEISIIDLRQRISKSELKRLAREMILLGDPFKDSKNSFQPSLISKEYKELQSLVSHRYFKDADYYLKAKLNEDGSIEKKVLDWKGDLLFEENLSPELFDDYASPPLVFELWVFKLSNESFASRPVTVGEVREWLEAFGGVHLYHNELRVSPYGDKGMDWLDMNLQRAKSPEERPSTNTVIGRVTILDEKEELLQKTDRSGFVESQSFLDVKRFCRNSLDWLARERLSVAEKRRRKAKKDAKNTSKDKKNELEESLKGVAPTVKKAIHEFEKAKEDEIITLKQDLQLYRTLSTAGITTAAFAHDSHGNPMKSLQVNAGMIKRLVKKYVSKEELKNFDKPFEKVYRAISLIESLGRTTLKLIRNDKRRTGLVCVNTVIASAVTEFKDYLESHDIDVQTNLIDAEVKIYGSDACIESIVFNLLTNAATALESLHGCRRKIVVSSNLSDVNSEGNIEVLISIADNGSGIIDISPDEIWLPGKTTKLNGTGLGLTIVKDTVEDLGGNVEINPKGHLGGAEFIITLPSNIE